MEFEHPCLLQDACQRRRRATAEIFWCLITDYRILMFAAHERGGHSDVLKDAHDAKSLDVPWRLRMTQRPLTSSKMRMSISSSPMSKIVTATSSRFYQRQLVAHQDLIPVLLVGEEADAGTRGDAARAHHRLSISRQAFPSEQRCLASKQTWERAELTRRHRAFGPRTRDQARMPHLVHGGPNLPDEGEA